MCERACADIPETEGIIFPCTDERLTIKRYVYSPRVNIIGPVEGVKEASRLNIPKIEAVGEIVASGYEHFSIWTKHCPRSIELMSSQERELLISIRIIDSDTDRTHNRQPGAVGGICYVS